MCECECEYEWNGIKTNKNQIKIRKSTWTCNLFSFDFAWRTHGHKRSLKCATAANTLDIISIIKIHRDEMLRFLWTLGAFFLLPKANPKERRFRVKTSKISTFLSRKRVWNYMDVWWMKNAKEVQLFYRKQIIIWSHCFN